MVSFRLKKKGKEKKKRKSSAGIIARRMAKWDSCKIKHLQAQLRSVCVRRARSEVCSPRLDLLKSQV